MIINSIITASGDLKPQIVVTAPTGSIVTCTTPGGIIIQGVEISGTWTFADLPGLGTYTVNAALGTQSKTKSVVVDRAGMFEVNIFYRLYLYNLGDECVDVTGGWTNQDYKYTADGVEINCDPAEKREDNIYFWLSFYGLKAIGFGTSNQIDFTGYSKLKVDWYRRIGNLHPSIFVSTTKNTNWSKYVGGGNTPTTRSISELDVSDISGNYYVFAVVQKEYEDSARSGAIYQIWLE